MQSASHFYWTALNETFKTLAYPIIFIPIEKSIFFVCPNKATKCSDSKDKTSSTTKSELLAFHRPSQSLNNFLVTYDTPRRQNNQVYTTQTRQKMNSIQVNLVLSGYFCYFTCDAAQTEKDVSQLMGLFYEDSTWLALRELTNQVSEPVRVKTRCQAVPLHSDTAVLSHLTCPASQPHSK